MVLLRVIGYILLFLAFMALGGDLLAWFETGQWAPATAGEDIYAVAPVVLERGQAIVQRYLLPEIWDPVILTVLLWPAWLVAGLPGLLLALLARRRRRRTMF